jgi:hypothetical protein
MRRIFGQEGNMASFNLLELVKVPLRCKSEVFIVSVNGDPQDMREFDFDDPNAKSVAIQQVVDIPAQTATQRARAFEDDRKTPFKFGLRATPVTMLLQGRKPSANKNDIGFEYAYFTDPAGKQNLCGSTAVGTVLKVDPTFKVQASGGASFDKRNKMLIRGVGDGDVKVTPKGIVNPAWTTDDPGGVFTPPDAFATRYDAGATPTPPGRKGWVRVTLTGIATNPPNQAIQATIDCTLSAPTTLRLDAHAKNPLSQVIQLDASKNPVTFDLIKAQFPYVILDQNNAPIHDETAYATRVPSHRENIRTVLTSPIAQIQASVLTNLQSVDQWTDVKDGKFTDTIKAADIEKAWILASQGRFSAAVDHQGAVILQVQPNHIWFLGVNVGGVVVGQQEGCHNTFSSTVTNITQAGAGTRVSEIEITSTYTVNIP